MGSASTPGAPPPAAPKRRRGRQTVKLHSIDAIRGIALLGVVVVHASVSFSRRCPPGWAACDAVSRSPLFDLILAFGNACGMQLFFIMAGLFAIVMLERAGLVLFLRSRYKGVLLPFLVCVVLILPPLQIVGLYGISKKVPPGSPKADVWASAVDLFTSTKIFTSFTWGHLWFLYYLLIAYVVFVITIPAWDKLFAADWFGRLARFVLRSRFKALYMALPTALLAYAIGTLAFSPWRVRPELDYLLYYLLFFFFGAYLYKQPELLRECWKSWVANLLVALLVFLPITGLFAAGQAVSGMTPAQFDELSGSWRLPPRMTALGQALAGNPSADVAFGLLKAFAYATVTWLLVFWAFGLTHSYFSRPRPVIRYLADASFWLYLCHFPIVLYLQIVVKDLPLPALVKFVIVFGTTTGVLLLAFHLFVRDTFIGAALGSSRAKLKRAFRS